MQDFDYGTPEQQKALREQADDVIRKAHELTFLKGTGGWQIVESTFDDIEAKSLEQLSQQRPGNDQAILAAHAVWYSVKHAYANVRSAIDEAISAGAQATELLKEIDEPEKWL